MQVRIREATPHEQFVTCCNLLWKPLNSKNGRWYPIPLRNIIHRNLEERLRVVNIVYTHHIPVVCRATYDRDKHQLKILPPEVKA